MSEYSYEDDIVKKMVPGPLGGLVPSLRAKNRHLFNNCDIEFDTSTGKCTVFSDTPIAGLTLIKQQKGQVSQKSIIRPEDYDNLEVVL